MGVETFEVGEICQVTQNQHLVTQKFVGAFVEVISELCFDPCKNCSKIAEEYGLALIGYRVESIESPVWKQDKPRDEMLKCDWVPTSLLKKVPEARQLKLKKKYKEYFDRKKVVNEISPGH